MIYYGFIETNRLEKIEMNSMNSALQAMTPKQEVLEKFVAILPQEMLDTMKADKMTSFDFVMFVIRVSVELKLCTVEQCWNLLFGDDTYAQFKNAIYDILESKSV